MGQLTKHLQKSTTKNVFGRKRKGRIALSSILTLQGERDYAMQDMMNLSMLVCATAASLAFGVLAAQALCRGAFAVLRMHASSVATAKVEKLEKVSATS